MANMFEYEFTRQDEKRTVKVDLDLIAKAIAENPDNLRSLVLYASKEALARLAKFAKAKSFNTEDFLEGLNQADGSGRFKVGAKDKAIGAELHKAFLAGKHTLEQLKDAAKQYGAPEPPAKPDSDYFVEFAFCRRVWTSLNPSASL